MRRTIPIMVSILFLTLSASAIPVAPCDTTCVLGGPDRWDGRFENAAGEADWQGWTHLDLYDTDNYWHVSTFEPVTGTYSMWCGTDFDGDPGYGNNWNQVLIFTYHVTDNSVNNVVLLTGTVRVDVEENWDYVFVEWNEGGIWRKLQDLTGAFDYPLNETVTYEPADYVGDGNDEIQLRFRVTSDGAASDEDGGWPSDGACQLDDITVTVDGVVVSAEDFESGMSADWFPDGTPWVGDFTALRSGLEDVDPDPAHQNDSWQVSFIDDGEVVPGTGGTPCVDWCYGPYGWVFNVTAGLDGHGVAFGPAPANAGVWNGVVSPYFSWPENADGGEIAFDVYAHMQTYECGVTTYGWTYRVTDAEDPAMLEEESWKLTRWSWLNGASMPTGPGYFRVAMPLDVSDVPGARWAQVRLEAFEGGPWCWGEYVTQGTPAPYFDNVAVRAWHMVTDAPPSAPSLSLDAAPNPFNPRVTLRWSQPVGGSVDLVVYDARGRRVRRLVLDDRAAGAGSVTWDGCDDAGAAVAAGVYLARLRTAAGTETCKLSLVR